MTDSLRGMGMTFLESRNVEVLTGWIMERAQEQLSVADPRPDLVHFAETVEDAKTVDAVPSILLGMVASRMYRTSWGTPQQFVALGNVIKAYIDNNE